MRSGKKEEGLCRGGLDFCWLWFACASSNSCLDSSLATARLRPAFATGNWETCESRGQMATLLDAAAGFGTAALGRCLTVAKTSPLLYTTPGQVPVTESTVSGSDRDHSHLTVGLEVVK